MQNQIVKYLKKYYLNYTDKKFSKLLNCTADEETFEVFQKIWKREHVGLYNLTEPFTPPERLL
jgi:hypothetical protein